MASDVYVGVDYTKIPLETLTITANGTYTPQSGLGFSEVNVDVPTSEPAHINFYNIDASTSNPPTDIVMVAQGGGIGGEYYITSVTVPVGNTFSVNNSGTLNINGGLADKGIQVKPNREVIVDNMSSFPVTYNTPTTVTVGTTTVTFQAGDLKVPVMSGSELVFPSGFATPTATTATVSGEITSINGAVIKDTSSSIVRGSSSNYSTSATNSYLAKFTGTNTIAQGPRVQILTSLPSTTGYSAGDIVFIV